MANTINQVQRVLRPGDPRSGILFAFTGGRLKRHHHALARLNSPSCAVGARQLRQVRGPCWPAHNELAVAVGVGWGWRYAYSATWTNFPLGAASTLAGAMLTPMAGWGLREVLHHPVSDAALISPLNKML